LLAFVKENKGMTVLKKVPAAPDYVVILMGLLHLLCMKKKINIRFKLTLKGFSLAAVL
jgi:hypothetical protein